MSDSRALRLQVILSAIDKATAPLRSISRQSQGTAKELRGTLDALKGLKQQQAAVGEFRTLQGALRSSAERLTAMRQRVDELKAGHAGDAQATQAHARELAAAQKAVANATQAYAAQWRQMGVLRERLGDLGIHNVARDEALLAGRIKATSAAIDQQRAKLNALAEVQRRHQVARAAYEGHQRLAGTMLARGAATGAAGAGLGAPVVEAVKVFAGLEDAMLGVARQVPDARDGAGRLTAVYAALKGEVQSLGHEIPLPTEQLAEMMAAGARMEVPTAALAGYTRQAAAMAIAFEAVPAEIAEQMGKVGKNFKIPVHQIGALADALNYLDDNSVAKGREIIDVLNRISGVVSTVKMSATDAAALASTLLTLGERPETAATAINAIAQKFAAATKGTKGFKAAVSEVGLSVEAIQQGMATDATATLLRVVDAVRQLPEEQRVGVMVELVGLEHSDTLAKLVDKPEEFERQRGVANGPAAQGSMQRDFDARMQNLSAQLQISRNYAGDLAEALGESLRPSLLAMGKAVNAVLQDVTAWVKEHPKLTSVLLQGAAAIAVVLAVLGSLFVAVAGLLGPLAVLRYGFGLLPILAGQAGAGLGMLSGAAGWLAGALKTAGAWGWTALQFVARGVLLVGRALIANPIGLAIAAIATAAYLIYEHWEPIKAFFSRLWEGVKAIFFDAIDALMGPLKALWDALQAPMQLARWAADKLGGMLGSAIGVKVDAPQVDTGRVRFDNRPSLPAWAATGRPVQVNAGPANVVVNAAPGMDERAVGREVARQLDRRERDLAAKGRSQLHDRD